jgi:Zn finger protein HypA/HybF involved in hydrogenase expression
MNPLDVRWHPRTNQMYILCDCGYRFWASVNRWITKCPKCKRKESTVKLRDDLVAKEKA